ncbi:MAG: metal-dependent transcriptional regulator [Candidatus Thorarchaeota archaeon]
MRSIKSTEDYLAVIWQLSNENSDVNSPETEKTVRIKDIAEKLQISSPSVSEYVRKLAKANKLDVIERKGVKLTDEGEKEAVLIINKHRIIECFLSQILKVSNAHEQSHDLEHVFELETIDKLYQFIKTQRNCTLENCPHETLCIPPSELKMVEETEA